MSKAFRTNLLFQKYINNTISKAELEELFLLLDDPENAEVAETTLHTLWKTLDNETNTQVDSAALFKKFQDKVKPNKVNYPYPRSSPMQYKWLAAACLVVMLGLGIFQFSKQIAPKHKLAATAQNRPVPAAVRRIELADGSIVILNKGSHLNYPAKFTGNTREVYLSGEGYFDIAHDAKKPFLVHTGKITTKVLGTAFNIKTGLQESTVEVTVTRGKVAVSDQKKTLAVLLPDQKASYNDQSNVLVKETTNAKIATLWKEEDLVLNNTSIQEAVNLLTARYGVQISLSNDKIKNCRFTAHFLNTSSITQILNVISQLNNLSWKNNGNEQYVLTGNGCE